MIFFWLKSIDLANKRVRARVEEGGHNIDLDIIERRYRLGIINLFDIYLPNCDYSMIFDNSEGKHLLIAEKSKSADMKVWNSDSFNQFKGYYEQQKF